MGGLSLSPKVHKKGFGQPNHKHKSRLRAELATSGSTLLKREDDHHARVLGEASRVSPPVAQHDDHPHLSGRLAQVQALHLKKSCMTMFLTIQGSSSGSHPGFKRRRSN